MENENNLLVDRLFAGMTKIKMSKEEAGSADFVERRRAALERFVLHFELLLSYGHVHLEYLKMHVLKVSHLGEP
jgi:hypothetical protein